MIASLFVFLEALKICVSGYTYAGIGFTVNVIYLWRLAFSFCLFNENLAAVSNC